MVMVKEMVAGCWFPVSRFKVRSSRFEVRGLKFEVRGSRFEVRGSKFEVQSSRLKVRRNKVLPTRRERVIRLPIAIGTSIVNRQSRRSVPVHALSNPLGLVLRTSSFVIP